MIRDLTNVDASAVLAIYQRGLDTGQASFETEAPSWEQWQSKYHPFCRLGFEDDGKLLGWAALAPISTRECYRGVAEISVYVDICSIGRGIGSQLLAELIKSSEAEGFWSLYSSIFGDNRATRYLHLRQGFRQIGFRERIAKP